MKFFKNVLFLITLFLASHSDVARANDIPASEIPSYALFHSKKIIPLPEEGWLIYLKDRTELSFQNVGRDEAFCGVIKPAGGAVTPAIYPHWDLRAQQIMVVRNTFIRVLTQASNTYEIEFRCGKGYQEGLFLSMPTLQEVREVLGRDFILNF